MTHGYRTNLICLGLASLIAVLFLGVEWPKKDVQRLDEVALGASTVSVFSERNKLPIHIDELQMLNLLGDNIRQTGRARTILWLGNSQLHAINQRESGQENAAAILHDDIAPNDTFLAAVSFPNANLQEHLVAVASTMEADLDIDCLLLPLVFDDTREIGLRPHIREYVDARPAITALLSSVDADVLIADPAKSKSNSTNSPTIATMTLQDRSEAFLENLLTENSSIWAERSQMRGQFFVGLYRFRNTVFGISAQTARKKIPARYDQNLNALKSLLRLATQRGCTVLAYIAPLRNDVSTPYIAEEYSQFRDDVADLCTDFPNVRCVDFEEVVPNSLWGTKASTRTSDKAEYDFMHFQHAGHRLLADRMKSEIASISGDTP